MSKIVKKHDKDLRLYQDLQKDLLAYSKYLKSKLWKRGMTHDEYKHYIYYINEIDKHFSRLLSRVRSRLGITSLEQYIYKKHKEGK